MNFHPVVYTRTNDFDFFYRARPPVFPGDVDLFAKEAMNEDRFPRMTVPRRVYYRSKKFLFWGMALLNEWFVPDEIADTWERKSFGLNLRGFWGGFMNLSGLTPTSLFLVASSLLERPDTACSLSDSLLEQSKFQPRAGDSKEDVRFSPMEFVGNSRFCFPARLQQHFVQKDWHNPKRPVREGEKRLYGQPMISQIPCDLKFFVPDFPLLADMGGTYHAPPKPGCIQLLHFGDRVQEERFWIDLVRSGRETCVISGISTVEHATLIAQSVPSLRLVLTTVPTAEKGIPIPSPVVTPPVKVEDRRAKKKTEDLGEHETVPKGEPEKSSDGLSLFRNISGMFSRKKKSLKSEAEPRLDDRVPEPDYDPFARHKSPQSKAPSQQNQDQEKKGPNIPTNQPPPPTDSSGFDFVG